MAADEWTAPGDAGTQSLEMDAAFMTLALEQARLALEHDDVPIGAVVVHGITGQVIGRGRNRREVDCDPTAHAEILALRDAAKTLGHWRLPDCTLYVTLEPCAMCAGALVNSRLARVVYGADDPKAGAVATLFQLCSDPRLNHRVRIRGGILAGDCAEILRAFFRRQRSLGKK